MSIKQAVLRATRASGLAALARLATGSSLRILGYHGVWLTPGYRFGNCTFVQPEQFEQRMARLKASGLPVLPLGDAVARLAARNLPRAAVVITIDDGWASTFTHMLPVLERYELPATLYSTTWYSKHPLPVINQAVDYLREAGGRTDIDRTAVIAEIEGLPIGERLAALRAFGAAQGVGEDWLELRQFHNMTPAELVEAKRRGLDIQLHTHRHIYVPERIDDLPREIAENRAFLAATIGERGFNHFCFPSGGHHPRAGDVLAGAAVRSATLCEEGINPPGTDPLALKRLLDGRDVSDATFDAYLSGVLHFIDPLRRMASRPSTR